ncbi:dimethlysulfonioproprionate lyase DddW [Apiospora arundinis]|uniref:Dimethlysulfonioproprionate lyase DddW n=1 Tax=Apiospora arundinis TaxID=335852 RepID=A0ABR2I484_9PEZI
MGGPGSHLIHYLSKEHRTDSDHWNMACAAWITQAQLRDKAKDQGHTLLEGHFPAQNDLKLTYSTELMNNYAQGKIVAPRSKLETLQTLQSGHSHALLFAMDSSFTAVVPILEVVERFPTYINTVDGGNIIFASGGERLFKLAQSSATGTKVWRVQDIALAVPLAEKALVFSSYTTTLHVSDLQDLPAEDGVELEISADALAPFYINGLYYLMGPKPARVLTNSAGLVNVVEAAAGLNATVLTVFIRHEPTSNITNPMQKAFDKLAALGSETALRAALIAVSTTAGGMAGADPKHKPRRALGQRGGPEEYRRQNGGPSQGVGRGEAALLYGPGAIELHLSSGLARHRLFGIPRGRGLLGLHRRRGGRPPPVAENRGRGVFEFTQDAATTTWHFIAKIAGKVYRAVLGTVEAIVGAIEWVFEQIKTGIETLIHLMTLCLRHQMDQLGAAKTAFDGQVGEVLQSHGYVMLGMYSDLKSLAPKITQMSVTEILKAFGALLADGMLISTQAVLDALLDTLVSIGTPSWTSPAKLRPASATS